MMHHPWQTEGKKHHWKVSKFHFSHFNLARIMEPILEAFCSPKRVFEHDSKYAWMQCNISEKKLEIFHNTVALSPMAGAPGRGHAGPCLPAPAWVTATHPCSLWLPHQLLTQIPQVFHFSSITYSLCSSVRCYSSEMNQNDVMKTKPYADDVSDTMSLMP